jgi:hypothetical protein
MLAIAITAMSTPPVVAHETMAARANQMTSTVESFYRFYGAARVTVNGAGDAVRPFCAAPAHVIAVSACCRRPLGIVLKEGAIRYSAPQAKQS